MTNDSLDFIKFIVQNWGQIKNISSTTWTKIKDLFNKGDKSLGFIKSKINFLNYYRISQESFLKKYAKYLIPTEYRGYLLQSIVISSLYKEGKNNEADKKRLELNSINPKALRIYNLYNSYILMVVFTKIEDMLREGKSEQEITGTASRMLDDLINDKAIIYVNYLDNMEDIYNEIKKQLNIKKYCVIIGSGKENTKKIIEILSKTINDPYFTNFEIKHFTEIIGTKEHYHVFIYERTVIQEMNNH